MFPMPTPRTDPTSHRSCGGRLVSTDERTLPLLSAALEADACGGVARVILEQRFYNPYTEPLQVTYQVPLPDDAAVSGYAFTIGERRVIGEVDRRQAARERFEEAILEGHTAALLEQDRSSLFTQELGNLPPGEEVVVELTIDQKLAWQHQGSWEWRFPTVVAPRYLGEDGRVADAARVSVDVATAPIRPRMDLTLSIRDALSEGSRPASPTHAIQETCTAEGVRVRFRSEQGAALDRDVAVRWSVVTPDVGVDIDVARPADGSLAGSAYGLLTIVPPHPDKQPRTVPRDLIVLLDTSGSMSGEPLDQARSVVKSLVESLGSRDSLELIEFSTRARRFRKKPERATARTKIEATAWLDNLRAGGATEMRTAIEEALKPVHPESQRQVVLITDGLIGFEEQVVEHIARKLPRGSRLHTVGVGSGVNRSLTGPAARAGRGIEVVIGLGENPGEAAEAILARTEAPLVVDLEIDGDAVERVVPAHLPDLFAGAPTRVSVKLRPGGGSVCVRGRMDAGDWSGQIRLDPVAPGAGSPAVTALFGREAVEDLEMQRAAGESAKKLDPQIEKLGLGFQIATRLTSWVAVSEKIDVDTREPIRRERVPHELPYGMSVEGLGLRPAAAPMIMQTLVGVATLADAARLLPPAQAPRRRLGLGRLFAREEKKAERPAAPGPRDEEIEAYDDQLEEEPMGPAEVAEPALEPVREMSGRLVLVKDGRWVIEILVEDEPFDWEAPEEVEVEDMTGMRFFVQVNPKRSTRPGLVKPGRSLRLELEPGADRFSYPPATLHLAVNGGTIVIRIR